MIHRKRLVGQVVSDKPNKTIVVSVVRKQMDPRYKKFLSKRHKYYAHDEENRCKIGDMVEIEETRPLSKLKHFRIVRILGEEK